MLILLNAETQKRREYHLEKAKGTEYNVAFCELCSL